MSSTSATRFITALLVLIFHISSTTAGFAWRSHSDVSPEPIRHAHAQPSVAVVNHIKDALDIVDELRSLPTPCKHRAGTNLIDFCLNYHDAGSRGISDAVIDNAEQLFAIHMVQCGLEEALQEWKSECRPLSTMDLHSPNLGRQLRICMDALYQDSQAWTTFENTKSRGLSVCRQLRNDVAKDEQLELFTALFETLFGLNHTMAQHQASFEGFREQFNNLKAAVHDLQDDLLAEHETLFAQMKESQNNIKKDAAEIATEMGMVRQASSEINGIFEHFRDYKSQMDEHLQTGMLKYGEELEIALSKHQYDLQLVLASVHRNVYEFTGSVQNANEVVHSLSGNLEDIRYGLAASLEQVGLVHTQMDVTASKQQSIGRQVDDMHSTINATQERLEGLNKAAGPFLDLYERILGFSTWTFATCLTFTTYFILATCAAICMFWPSSIKGFLVAIAAGLGKSHTNFVTGTAVNLTRYCGHPFELVRNLLSGEPGIAGNSTWTSSSSVAMFLLGAFAGALVAKVVLNYRAQVYDPESPPQYAPSHDYYYQESPEDMLETGSTMRGKSDQYYAD
ncbi:uncharacterized protein MYCFIDRAFT_169831 [Pseudocercospora fijiensis CIRAD86]|uniref:Nuclear fusion protein KAR5 n=1 Tax=Pseudocercospora fijiensis (strain CIRAD86) TaxID=383855 RepID=N1QAX8_PSEFD|nr:uncharacterized protein MYCFIDRAFT_169831 [Pseudocercospora fijiensis CIRAD86]EME88153.1 hypothetical protein MYCFIDRAFT_169831 [Pseudocercospora fijiensis CIRAD86]